MEAMLSTLGKTSLKDVLIAGQLIQHHDRAMVLMYGMLLTDLEKHNLIILLPSSHLIISSYTMLRMWRGNPMIHS